MDFKEGGDGGDGGGESGEDEVNICRRPLMLLTFFTVDRHFKHGTIVNEF